MVLSSGVFNKYPGKRKTRLSRVGNAFDGLNAGKTR